MSGGRIDNPAHYSTLYCAERPAAAVLSKFQAGYEPWDEDMFADQTTGRPHQLVTYELADTSRIVDLDKPHELVANAIRPAEVMSWDRPETQRWALRLFEQGKWTGCRWWSRYEPSWGLFGLWDVAELEFSGCADLHMGHHAVKEAVSMLKRAKRDVMHKCLP